jgi:dsDNA-specific endonuclease/ATPase MutS2
MSKVIVTSPKPHHKSMKTILSLGGKPLDVEFDAEGKIELDEKVVEEACEKYGFELPNAEEMAKLKKEKAAKLKAEAEKAEKEAAEAEEKAAEKEAEIQEAKKAEEEAEEAEEELANKVKAEASDKVAKAKAKAAERYKIEFNKKSMKDLKDLLEAVGEEKAPKDEWKNLKKDELIEYIISKND